MQNSGLNSNKQRKEFWQQLIHEEQAEELEKGLVSIHPDSARVLRWHYTDEYSLQEIVTLLGRSISIVRNHHNRGIFELQQYFRKKHLFANTDHP